MAFTGEVPLEGNAGYFVVEVLSQTLWREDPLTVGRRCHAGAVKVLESVSPRVSRWRPQTNHRPG